ncbi:MAG: 4Fe-4S ferredoxin [Candidatus Altiarchaeales archaeon WOR_SM1_86-2]|nr:MAG: 4Fe-4S ferredoxin [Candidatus Altiarchaeales archaeon WOR_SM1_86-2]
MAIRKIIKIDEEKCNGCGKCLPACAEGAIKIVNGKAKLISEKYCDGLGACIGKCPRGAITIEEREAERFDEKAVEEHLAENEGRESEAWVCPSAVTMQWEKIKSGDENIHGQEQKSELSQWPVKLNIVHPTAGYFQGADLVVAADCAPVAYGNFHNDFLKGKSIVMGCPKFDDIKHYIKKLTEIFKHSGTKSITIARMEVPCCSGLTFAVENALKASGKSIPLKEEIITIKGKKE